VGEEQERSRPREGAEPDEPWTRHRPMLAAGSPSARHRPTPLAQAGRSPRPM
jgi:hypothetical protein